MSKIAGLGLEAGRLPLPEGTAIEELIVQRPLHRVLAFTGKTIDDIVNDPISKNHVLGYYKMMRQVQRGCEVVDLERWWNPLGR